MDIVISSLEIPMMADLDVEIIERKGIGHPDTMCDALAEQVSRALCRYYLDEFGTILHHNVDKVLLWGGVSEPCFGGGKIIDPFEVFITGRATCAHKGRTIPVSELAREACHEWLVGHFHGSDYAKRIKIHTLIRPGSSELVELFMRQQQTGVYLANDTSCGVGYAPLSDLEKTVLRAEARLNHPATKNAYPQIGQDIKIMAVRNRKHIDLTLGCAMIDRYIADIQAYLAAKNQVVQLTRETFPQGLKDDLSIAVNAADVPETGGIYLTVTGTSAEAGDDGQTGRGNRSNGLITPLRPMTMESVAGKNPVSHVGKLYNIAGGSLAVLLVNEVSDIREAYCLLVSRIGSPISEPQLVNIKLSVINDRPVKELAPKIREIVDSELSGIQLLWEKVIGGQVSIY